MAPEAGVRPLSYYLKQQPLQEGYPQRRIPETFLKCPDYLPVLRNYLQR